MPDKVMMSRDETILMIVLYGAFLMNDLTSEYVTQARSLLSKTPHWKQKLKFHVNRAADACRFFHMREEIQALRRQLFEYRDFDTSFTDADGEKWDDVNFGESSDRFSSIVKLNIEDTLRNWYENEFVRAGAPYPRAYSFLTTAYSLCRISCEILDHRMKLISHYPWADRQRHGSVYYDHGEQTKALLAKLLKMDAVRTNLHDALATYVSLNGIHHDHEEHVRRTEKVIRLFSNENTILSASRIDYVHK